MQSDRPSFKGFFLAFGANWFTKMSGPLTVPFTIGALFAPVTWAKAICAALAIVCGGGASYAIWEHERKKLCTEEELRKQTEAKLYDGRPLLVLHVAEVAGTREKPILIYDKSPAPPPRKKKLPKFVVQIQNCGNRTARWIDAEVVRSDQGNYLLTFGRIPSLEPSSSLSLPFEVRKVHTENSATLDDFLYDTRDGTYVTWYDFKIHFRDTDDSAKEEMMRLSYWPGSCVFNSSEVPYTRKDFKQQ